MSLITEEESRLFTSFPTIGTITLPALDLSTILPTVIVVLAIQLAFFVGIKIS